MLRTLTRGAALLAMAMALAGCAPTATKETKETDDNDAACPHCAVKADKTGEGDGCCDGCCADDEKPKAAVTLKAVKLDELTQALAAHKGKVVVLDLWASSCEPCVKAFPQLVKLHQTYAPDGLVCVSVSVDGEEDEAAALAFLKTQQATFPNYRLADESDDWRAHWQVDGVPALLVFGRDGKQAGKFTTDESFTHDDHVVPLVRKLLRAE